MFVASYRNTERGAALIAARKQALNASANKAVQIQVASDEAERRAREAVERMEALAERQRKAVADVEAANAALDRLRGGNGWSTVSRVVARICKATGVTKGEILSARRDKRVSFARQAIFYWVCRRTRLSLPEIGRRLGKDHTTVLHGKRVYPNKRAKMGRHLRPVL